MTSEEKNQLLDHYISGYSMSEEDEARVQFLLKTDAAFREEYKLRQALYEAGVQERRAAWENRRQKKQPANPGQIAFPMSWVAAAVLLLTIGIGFIFWQKTADANQSLSGQLPLYEQRDNQLGLAPGDSAVGQITWVVSKAETDEYEFGQADSLQIFTRNPDNWQHQKMILVRISEVRYELRAGNEKYELEQGRSLRLPLKRVP